jgi:aspartate oxidase
MIHVFLDAAHSANSNNFQAVFRRCITTKIWVETQTNPCVGVMHYVAVGQVTVRVFGLSFALSFLSCSAPIQSSVSDAM